MSFGRYSVLPALSLQGVLIVQIIEGSVDHIAFEAFVTDLMELMEPFPGPNSVLVLDNASIHKNESIVELARDQ
jgi:hypothetical protein